MIALVEKNEWSTLAAHVNTHNQIEESHLLRREAIITTNKEHLKSAVLSPPPFNNKEKSIFKESIERQPTEDQKTRNSISPLLSPEDERASLKRNKKSEIPPTITSSTSAISPAPDRLLNQRYLFY